MSKKWGTPEEKERRNRILISMWAYAYEFENTSLVSDAVYDKMAKKIDVNRSTGHPKLDKWFKKNYLAHTGQWIHKHPELAKLKARFKELHRV